MITHFLTNLIVGILLTCYIIAFTGDAMKINRLP